jgi:hypothetical protein
MNVPIPIQALLGVYLGTQDDGLRDQIARLISREANKARKGRNSQGLVEFEKMLKQPLGTVLPFTASPIDLDLARIFASHTRSGFIYSKDALVSAGAIQISQKGCRYLDQWFDAKSEAPDFTIFPRDVDETRERINNRKPPELRVAVGSVISLAIHCSEPPLEAKNRNRSANTMNVHVFDPRRPRTGAISFQSAWAQYDQGKRCIEIKAATPEAILQLSAYGAEGMWMSASSDTISTCFPIPELDDAEPHTRVWASDWDTLNQYAHCSTKITVSVPLSVAVAGAREFTWFYIGNPPALSRQLALEASKN